MIKLEKTGEKSKEKMNKIVDISNAIEHAIENGVKKIYIDEDCGVWEYEPAEPRVVILEDLEALAYENKCEIEELDAATVVYNINCALEAEIAEMDKWTKKAEEFLKQQGGI